MGYGRGDPTWVLTLAGGGNVIGELIGSIAGPTLGVAVGYGLARISRRSSNRDPKPICGCGHHLAHHDPGTGECYAENEHWDEHGNGTHYARCTCRQYVGPKPADEFFSTQLAWNSTVMRIDKPQP
jgi:hypothetical protein